MYKLCFYVPEDGLERVKESVFSAGAGSIGRYDQCCWQVLGEGQFRPLAQSQPTVGQINQLEKIAEYRVEMVCSDSVVQRAVEALKKAHPYEEPAYQVWKLEDI